jgi:hypothetical protein
MPPTPAARMRQVRRQRRRFRWFLLTVPLALLGARWLSQGIDPAFSWDDFLDALHVRDRTRVTMLATLGVLVTAAVAIVRVVRGRRDDSS